MNIVIKRIFMGVFIGICLLIILNITNVSLLTRYKTYQNLSESSKVEVIIEDEVAVVFTKDDIESFVSNNVRKMTLEEEDILSDKSQCVLRFHSDSSSIKEVNLSFVEFDDDSDAFVTRLEDGRAYITYITYQSLFQKKNMVIKLSDELEFKLGDILLTSKFTDQSQLINKSALNDRFISMEIIEKDFNLTEVNETELFELSSEADKKRVYIYMVYPKSYQRIIVECDTASNEIIELPVDELVQTIYYSFPEFKTVRAITVSDSPDVIETANFEIPTPTRKDVVGGTPTRRIFSQAMNTNAFNNLEFVIYNAFDDNDLNADSIIFGRYFFKLIY